MSKAASVPMRMCVGCRQMKPKTELIRIVRTPEQVITVDTSGKSNGRGAYICRSQACLDKAVRNQGLKRSLGCSIEDTILQALREEIEQ